MKQLLVSVLFISHSLWADDMFLTSPESFLQKHQELIITLLYGLSATVVLGSLTFSWVMYRSRKIIAQREQALTLISESMNRAQKIAHLGNWEWDVMANTLWWSDEIYRIFGLEPQQFKATYEGFLEHVHPDDRETVQEAVSHTLLHYTDYHIIHRIIKQDGTVRYVLEEGNVKVDETGKPLRMRGVVQDITEEKNALSAVEESEKKYRDLVENSMIGIYRMDIHGQILYMNQALAEILSFDSPDELIGQNSAQRYYDSEQSDKFIHRLTLEKQVSHFEIELRNKYSASVPVVISAKLEENIISGIIIDMRELKKSRSEIDKLSTVVEQIDDIVVITDKDGTIAYVNQAFSVHTGFSKNEALGKTPRILKSDRYTNEYYKILWTTILKGEIFREIIINRKKNGEIYFENQTITPLKDDKKRIVGFVSTGKDVTEETLLNQEIKRIAMIDKLTGIYNRHKAEELFALEAERSRRFSHPLSMILIDIDHFKSVNDTFGHDIGDEVLKQLADIVQENIRKIDIFARWGGEEFLLLSPGTDLTQIKVLGEKLRVAVDNATFPEIGHITISSGISTFEKDDTLSTLFKRADQGLYHAKVHGRNQVGVIGQ